MFQTISRNTQGGTAHHIFNILFRQLGSAEKQFSDYEENYGKPVHFCRRNIRNGGNAKVDDIDDVVIRSNVHEFYTPTINNLLSVLKLTLCQLSIKIKTSKKQYHNSKNI